MLAFNPGDVVLIKEGARKDEIGVVIITDFNPNGLHEVLVALQKDGNVIEFPMDMLEKINQISSTEDSKPGNRCQCYYCQGDFS